MSFLKSTRAKIITLIIILALVLVGLLPWLSYAYRSLIIKASSSPVCYSWDMGGHSARGVRYKQCVCDGRLDDLIPPLTNPDSGRTHCVGKIIGYSYNYSGRDFSDFDAWNKFCENVRSPFTERCFEDLERTRAAEQKLKV